MVVQTPTRVCTRLMMGRRGTGLVRLGEGEVLETKLAWYEHTLPRNKLGRVGVVGGLDLQTEEVFLGTSLGSLCLAWESRRQEKL